MAEGHRSAEIEPKRVVAEFRLLLPVQVGEKGIRVKGVVADIFPGAAVVLLGAALGGHGDHAARGLPEVSAVVARQDLEFLQRVLRRGHDQDAATAAGRTLRRR